MARYKIDWYWLRGNPYGVYVSRLGWFGRQTWEMVDTFDTLEKAEAFVTERIAADLPKYYPAVSP